MLIDIFIKRSFFQGCKGRGREAEWQKNRNQNEKKEDLPELVMILRRRTDLSRFFSGNIEEIGTKNSLLGSNTEREFLILEHQLRLISSAPFSYSKLPVHLQYGYTGTYLR